MGSTRNPLPPRNNLERKKKKEISPTPSTYLGYQHAGSGDKDNCANLAREIPDSPNHTGYGGTLPLPPGTFLDGSHRRTGGQRSQCAITPLLLEEVCSRHGHRYLSRSPSRLSRLVDVLRLPQVCCEWITYLRTPTESISSVLGALSQLANARRSPIFYKPRSLHLVNDLRGFETWLKGLMVDHSVTLHTTSS